MQLFCGKVRDDDFLMVNVNTNQRRKGVPQSLQIVAELKELREEGDPEFRLYLHMTRENRDEGTCLGLVARQLGLIEGEDVFFGDPNFVNGRPILSDEGLNRIYNAADLYLTTSLGEGWGLGVTEAMAAGTPVAGRAHEPCGTDREPGAGTGAPAIRRCAGRQLAAAVAGERLEIGGVDP